ncbi:DNA cytosine methyltransferase [Polynucleobacter sp. MWH-Adler-W8]|uniref:DNA cytosine methyltransferase n=1 Tax=Polynucleobacter sp. MWH-Adler-W8 TaxID=1819727 RepID=UPI0009296270|nr:DNA cytosine methyltransferase [Polynucleobacter sp. MWH-Adler-W8]OJI06017.1 DNA (cytosine-5-)-methyltransferase [Polynucleobacter sp. MWH-Adler-W8]
MKHKKLYVADFFAGCGGLSFGLELAGFHPAYVNELNKDAIESYLLNREDEYPYLRDIAFHCNDIKDLVLNKKLLTNTIKEFKNQLGINIKNGDLDLLVGGPPCQGFSGIGHRRSYSVDKEQLPSNHLYEDMAYVVSVLKPKIFLFENVKGLLSAKWNGDGVKGEIWDDVQSTFKKLKDYQVNFSLVRAKDYGVSQNRPRVLLVGIRNDVYKKSESLIKGSVANGFLPSPTYEACDLDNLLGDLVDDNYVNGGFTDKYVKPAKTKIQKYFRTTTDGKVLAKGASLTEQEYSKHAPNVLAKFKYMHAHDGKIHESMQTKKFAQRVLPAKWDEGGPSITATSLPDDYVHFSQPRTLTVREWARLQGFPDYYRFAGSRTTGGIRRAGNPREGNFARELPKYTQIGNAVPVFLAKAVGEHFAKIINKANES